MKSAVRLGNFGGMTAVSPDVPDAPEIGHDHPDVTGGWLRPAVFGAMDGLVSNVALIAGMAGGTQHVGNTSAVVLAGVAGLVGGAFSMATGEYVSVASQSEAAAREIDKERREIIRNPAGETAELAEMYIEKGLEPRLAAEVARQIHADVENAVSVHAREELGVDPADLASPRLAAASSFLSFAVGALVPLLPYLLGSTSLLPAVVLTLVTLFVCGAVVAKVTVRPWWYGGVRQALLGGVAAAVTYAFGLLIGGLVGG
jgi:VIT1/CCC1 family predicted Fe2+/Mn2+ transporter